MPFREHTRQPVPDLLRGVAVLLMVQVHIMELFADTSVLHSAAGRISLFLGAAPVAPVFMLLMGYFTAAAGKTRAQLLARGTKIFLLGMVLNIVLNFNLILSVYRGTYTVDLLPYVFGVDILQFSGLSIVVIALLKGIFEKSLPACFIAIILAALGGSLLPGLVPKSSILIYLSAFFYGSSSWSYFPLLPWICYPLSGFLAYRIQQKYSPALVEKWNLVWVLPVFILFLAFTAKYATAISSDLPSYYHHGLLFYLWTLAFFSGYAFLAHKADLAWGNHRLMHFLKWMGRNVTVIYLIQWAIIGNIATEVYKTIASPAYLLGSFVLIVGFSCAACALFLRIRERYAAAEKSTEAT